MPRRQPDKRSSQEEAVQDELHAQLGLERSRISGEDASSASSSSTSNSSA